MLEVKFAEVSRGDGKDWSISGGVNNINTNGAGIVDVRNLSVPPDSEIQIQFDVTLASVLAGSLDAALHRPDRWLGGCHLPADAAPPFRWSPDSQSIQAA